MVSTVTEESKQQKKKIAQEKTYDFTGGASADLASVDSPAGAVDASPAFPPS